jgi:hypothetical protein
LPLYPQNYRLSWRELGDPQLLNADGFTYLWSPWYDSGSDKPIYNYYAGKYSHGTPTANINGFLNFFSDEERHMFREGQSVERVYHIWLPPGPVEAGYAVDACWEPPTVTPVTDPVNDFPYSANQPEMYRFKVVLNDGKPFDKACCTGGSVYNARAEYGYWYIMPPFKPENIWVGIWDETMSFFKTGYNTEQCNTPPEHPDWECLANMNFPDYPNGTYQLLAWEGHAFTYQPSYLMLYPTFDVFEVTLDW